MYEHRDAIAEGIATKLSRDGNEVDAQVKIQLLAAYGELQSTDRTHQDDNLDLPMTEVTYLLPPGLVGTNEAFNEGVHGSTDLKLKAHHVTEGLDLTFLLEDYEVAHAHHSEDLNDLAITKLGEKMEDFLHSVRPDVSKSSSTDVEETRAALIEAIDWKGAAEEVFGIFTEASKCQGHATFACIQVAVKGTKKEHMVRGGRNSNAEDLLADTLKNTTISSRPRRGSRRRG